LSGKCQIYFSNSYQFPDEKNNDGIIKIDNQEIS